VELEVTHLAAGGAGVARAPDGRVEVVDAFPSTFHVETVSRFRAAR